MWLTKHFFILLCTLLLLVLASFFFKTGTGSSSHQTQDVTKIITDCKQEKIKDTCYAEKFTEVTKNNSLEYTLQVLDEFQKKTAYPSCHFIGHIIAGTQVKKNPALWVETITKFPDEKCSGGFIMGTLEAVGNSGQKFSYNKEKITKLCQNIQKIKKGNADQTCIHTIGHLVLVDKNGNINSAIEFCNLLIKNITMNVYREYLWKMNTKEIYPQWELQKKFHGAEKL